MISILVVEAASVAGELLLFQMNIVEKVKLLVVLAIMAHLLKIDGTFGAILWSILSWIKTGHDHVWFYAFH